MATQVVLQGLQARAVYDDRWRTIYQALGATEVERATEVEFDNASGDWHAVHLASGAVIATGPNRSEVIEREIEWLEREWFKTTDTTKREDKQLCRTPSQ